MIFCIRMIPVDTLWILQNRTIKLWEAKNEKRQKQLFLIAPFALWGCISVWTSNLVRLTDKSAVPYAWASLFFSYGIVAVHYIQVAVSSKGCNNAETKNCMGSAWAFNFVLDSSCCSSYSMKESKVITQSSVRSQYFLFQQYSSSFSICMVHIYLPRSIHLKGKI